jgi:hypothetical protein
MAQKGQPGRSLARFDRRPTGGSQGEVVASDPITVGPDRTINIDLAKLPSPLNVYDADFAWIEHHAGRVSLLFGKGNRDEPGKLRTRLEVRYPPENLVGNFWRNSREFHRKLRAYVDKWPADGLRDSVDPAKMPAGRDHSECANFEAIAHAGTEAVIDFYLMPPVGIARYAQGQGSAGLKFSPVVRVHLSIFELIRLLDASGSVVEQINSYLPKPQHEVKELVEERK